MDTIYEKDYNTTTKIQAKVLFTLNINWHLLLYYNSGIDVILVLKLENWDKSIFCLRGGTSWKSLYSLPTLKVLPWERCEVLADSVYWGLYILYVLLFHLFPSDKMQFNKCLLSIQPSQL